MVLQASDRQDWDAITERRRQDLLVYLALSHFSRRPRCCDLSPLVQNDIKALFGSYKQACTAADLMLLSLGNLGAIAQRCRESAIGQQRPNSLWVHVSALEQLDPLLRLPHQFAKLSQQERNWGLLDEIKAIYDRRGWEKCLEEHGAELRGIGWCGARMLTQLR
ncbi:MAG: hypothetical protein ACFB8W_25160 [Elainellaceae cyanobacterium]